MSCGSSVPPLIVPAVPSDEIVQGTPMLREDLFLHLEAPIEVIEMFAQEEPKPKPLSERVLPCKTPLKNVERSNSKQKRLQVQAFFHHRFIVHDLVNGPSNRGGYRPATSGEAAVSRPPPPGHSRDWKKRENQGQRLPTYNAE
ncbi:hypothetical protein E4U59_005918 [Claviceps monticola]|nr:hypothetical protein E4U59_005918 [Claviceps monticola]